MSFMNKPAHLAKRMEDIRTFHVMNILAQAKNMERAGRSIIHMEAGEPDFSTPQPIVEAGKAALMDGKTQYTAATGLPELREAIAQYYQHRYGVEVAPRRIIVTPGASGALILTTAAVIDPGSSLLLADPAYPCNRHFARLFEGSAINVPVCAETNYQLNPELLSQHWRDDSVGALVATPANPTGTLIPQQHLAEMARFCAGRNGVMIVDELYHGLVYGDQPSTTLTMGDNVFVINSFSKYFGMTGWRLGWVVAPSAYVDAIDRLAQNLFLAASTPAQYAALAAFEPATIEILEQRREVFQQRRDFLVPALRELGFEIPVVPQGAFYVYANCEHFTDDSFSFAEKLLEEAGVAITPGIDFGEHQAEKHVRFAYTTSMENLKEGIKRMGKWLA